MRLKTDPFRSDILTLSWWDIFRLAIGRKLVDGALEVKVSGHWTTVTVLLAILALLLSACAQPRRSIRELEAQGYADVTITGPARAACGVDEDFATGFLATLDGQAVEGAVCHAPFGGDVVRFRRVTP